MKYNCFNDCDCDCDKCTGNNERFYKTPKLKNKSEKDTKNLERRQARKRLEKNQD